MGMGIGFYHGNGWEWEWEWFYGNGREWEQHTSNEYWWLYSGRLSAVTAVTNEKLHEFRKKVVIVSRMTQGTTDGTMTFRIRSVSHTRRVSIFSTFTLLNSLFSLSSIFFKLFYFLDAFPLTLPLIQPGDLEEWAVSSPNRYGRSPDAKHVHYSKKTNGKIILHIVRIKCTHDFAHWLTLGLLNRKQH